MLPLAFRMGLVSIYLYNFLFCETLSGSKVNFNIKLVYYFSRYAIIIGYEKIGKVLDNGTVENGMYFFVPDTISSYENKFMLKYYKVDITTFSGQITYQKAEKLKIFGKEEYYIYNTSEEDIAWQKPNYKFTFAAWYDIADKIVVKGSIFIVGARESFSYKEPDIENHNIKKNPTLNKDKGRYEFTLKPFIDINLGLEYRYNKRISAFVDFNNFIAVKYQRCIDYYLS